MQGHVGYSMYKVHEHNPQGYLVPTKHVPFIKQYLLFALAFITMFNFGAKPNSKIAVVPPKIRLEKAAPAKKPQPLPSKIASRPAPRPQDPARTSSSKARTSSATPDRLEPRKRKAVRQKSPVQQRIESSSDDDSIGTPASFDEGVKRHKPSADVDLKRELRYKSDLPEEDGSVFPMIHAADIASTTRKSKKVTATEEENVTIQLQYPGAKQRERYVRI
jgi:H3 lysine-79-specific histone-lysine N-methyltransferase